MNKRIAKKILKSNLRKSMTDVDSRVSVSVLHSSAALVIGKKLGIKKFWISEEVGKDFYHLSSNFGYSYYWASWMD